MDENGEILLLHASNNNARPLVLPWFDDFGKKHLTGRFFIINGQNMFKGLFLLVKHLVFSAANTSIYSELAFNHCLTTSIFASKNLEKVDMVKVFLALVTKCVTFLTSILF